jgi:hypothetical protein
MKVFLRNSFWLTRMVSYVFDLCGKEKWIGNVIARSFKQQYGVGFGKTLLLNINNKKMLTKLQNYAQARPQGPWSTLSKLWSNNDL